VYVRVVKIEALRSAGWILWDNAIAMRAAGTHPFAEREAKQQEQVGRVRVAR
jgi:hypothetical protein